MDAETRDRAAVLLLERAMSKPAIAAELGISYEQVRTVQRNLLRLAGVIDRAKHATGVQWRPPLPSCAQPPDLDAR